MLRKNIRPICNPPWGYRIAWYNILTQQYATYPFGIHWIAKGIHSIWEWSHYYEPSQLEVHFAMEFARGQAHERLRSQELLLEIAALKAELDEWKEGSDAIRQ